MAQDAPCRVRGIAAFQKHRVVLLTRDVVWEDKGVASKTGQRRVFIQSTDKCQRHRKERGRLIKVVLDDDFFKVVRSHKAIVPCLGNDDERVDLAFFADDEIEILTLVGNDDPEPLFEILGLFIRGK